MKPKKNETVPMNDYDFDFTKLEENNNYNFNKVNDFNWSGFTNMGMNNYNHIDWDDIPGMRD